MAEELNDEDGDEERDHVGEWVRSQRWPMRVGGLLFNILENTVPGCANSEFRESLLKYKRISWGEFPSSR